MRELWVLSLHILPLLVGLAYLFHWLGFKFEDYAAVRLLFVIPIILLAGPVGLYVTYRLCRYGIKKGSELPNQPYWYEEERNEEGDEDWS